MATVTKEEVKKILDPDIVIEDDAINAFILGAVAITDGALSGSGLSASILLEIQRWLSAHLISSTVERMAAQEEAGTAKIKYTGTYGMALNSTTYGQMAISLDSTGALSNLNKAGVSLFAIPETHPNV